MNYLGLLVAYLVFLFVLYRVMKRAEEKGRKL